MDTSTAVAVSQPAARQQFLLVAISRGLAIFIGVFSLINMLGELLVRHFNANLWLIDFRQINPKLAQILLLLAALGLLSWGIGIPLQKFIRRVVYLLILVLLGVAIGNTINFFLFMAKGSIHASVPVPISLLLTVGLFSIIKGMADKYVQASSPKARRVTIVTVLACLVLFPLLQIFLFGKTDYRRHADAIVVFGARAYADGTPSNALADRVRTACELYNDGLAQVLIFSGGPGDGAVHETEAMKRMAIKLGVPDSAIIRDEGGVDTQATVRNTTILFQKNRFRRIMAVSHFFHLPRIKMTYQRAGWDVYTVPAYKPALHDQVPFLVCREVVALWKYYFNPLSGK